MIFGFSCRLSRMHQKFDIYMREFEEVYCALLPFPRITVCLMIIAFVFFIKQQPRLHSMPLWFV